MFDIFSRPSYVLQMCPVVIMRTESNSWRPRSALCSPVMDCLVFTPKGKARPRSYIHSRKRVQSNLAKGRIICWTPTFSLFFIISRPMSPSKVFLPVGIWTPILSSTRICLPDVVLIASAVIAHTTPRATRVAKDRIHALHAKMWPIAICLSDSVLGTPVTSASTAKRIEVLLGGKETCEVVMD